MRHVVDGQAIDGDAGPGSKHGIAVFAEHEGLNGIRIHIGLFYNLGNQSGGIQSGAGAQYAALWEAKAVSDFSGNDVGAGC